MSDNPTVRRAAEVIQRQRIGLMGARCHELAEALAAAGLLANPTTPTVTDERTAAVVEAAKVWRRIHYAMHGNTSRASKDHQQLVRGVESDLRAAVDRLTATDQEASQ